MPGITIVIGLFGCFSVFFCLVCFCYEMVKMITNPPEEQHIRVATLESPARVLQAAECAWGVRGEQWECLL